MRTGYPVPLLAAGTTGLDLLEEVVALVVHKDESREVLDLYFPDSFHAKFGVFHTLNALDVVLCEDGGRATDGAEIETTMLLAGIGHGLRTVSFSQHHHRSAMGLE